ncbi:MAG: hypothetical protein H6825_10725 [Planctomycetes bacterium]|nr:hypothetical protein [Planctomycetota bacterium]
MRPAEPTRVLLLALAVAAFCPGALDPACVPTLHDAAAWEAAAGLPLTFGPTDLHGRRASFDLFTNGDEVQGESTQKLARLRKVKVHAAPGSTPGGVPYTRSLAEALGAPASAGGGKPEPDRRVAIVARKGAGVYGAASSSRVHTGPFEARITVAVDSLEGLLLGKAAGVLEADLPPDADPSRYTFVRARTLSDGDGFAGFVVDAVAQSGALGTPVLVPGTNQVDLRIVRDEDALRTYTRRTPTSADDVASWTLVSSQVAPLDEPSFSVLFGAAGLIHGGRILFSGFSLVGPGVGGPLERPLVDALVEASAPLLDALSGLAAPAPDLEAAAASAAAGRDALLAVAADVSESELAGAFQPTTFGKAAGKLLGRAAARVEGALSRLEHGKPGPAAKRLERAARDVLRALADLLGRKARSFGALPDLRVLPD